MPRRVLVLASLVLALPATLAVAPATADVADAAGRAPEGRVCGKFGVSRPVGGGLRAAHDVGVGGLVDGNGAGAHAAATVELGASLWFDVDGCRRAQELDLDLRATPRWSSAVGVGSIDTTAALRFGPTPHADPDLGVLAWTLNSWEVGFHGALHAQPGLSDRHDLARELFDRYLVTAGTRAFRVALADVCRPDDQRPECQDGKGARTPTPMTLDLFAAEGAVGLTDQGQRRHEARGAFSMMRVEAHQVDGHAIDALVDLLRVEHEVVTVGDTTGTIDIIWPLYFRTTNPRTGTQYVIGWGSVVAFELDDGMRQQTRDHRALSQRDVGGLGFTTGGHERGTGLGWNRTAYVTMAAEPVLEDRLVAEAWGPISGLPTRVRAFAARLERLTPADGQAPIVWTGGVELGGTTRVRGIDVDLTSELGRSYYAALDGGEARAGFGARVQLSLRHTGDARWAR